MIQSRFRTHKDAIYLAAFAISAACLISANTTTPAIAKDIAPQNAACDQLAKGGPAWRQCAANSTASDDELFYAGYWLTKSGRHAEALTYLNRTKIKTDRVLTYIGYATRKTGDIEGALHFYNAALTQNPDFVIARSYLGEAHLTRGDRKSALRELDEISNRCGRSCAAYSELADAVHQFDVSRL